MRILQVVLFMVLLPASAFHLASAEEGALPKEDPSGIYFRDGRLKVSVEKQKFMKVMEEVGRKAGIEIVSEDQSDEEVTSHFDYRPLEEGLEQLMMQRSYILFYQSGKDGTPRRLSRVLILAKSGEGGDITSGTGGARDRDASHGQKASPEDNEARGKKISELLIRLGEGDAGKEGGLRDALQKLREILATKPPPQGEGNESLPTAPDETRTSPEPAKSLQQLIREQMERQKQAQPQ